MLRAWNLSLHASKTSWSWSRFCWPKQSASPCRSAAPSTQRSRWQQRHAHPLLGCLHRHPIRAFLPRFWLLPPSRLVQLHRPASHPPTELRSSAGDRPSPSGTGCLLRRRDPRPPAAGILDFQQHYVASTVAAQVIGTSGSDLSRVLYIDKGSKNGLKPDQAVITPDGIIGKLRDVFPHTSQVLLINDQTSGAGVVLATTRLRAILRGSSAARFSSTTSRPTHASSLASRFSPQAATRFIRAVFLWVRSSPSSRTLTTSRTR